MPTRIRTITAPTVPKAFQKVREEMGEDAFVLDTKTVRAPGLKGLFGVQWVELRVALNEPFATAGLGPRLPNNLAPLTGRSSLPDTFEELEKIANRQPPPNFDSIAPTMMPAPAITAITTTPPVAVNFSATSASTPAVAVGPALSPPPCVAPDTGVLEGPVPVAAQRLEVLEKEFKELKTMLNRLAQLPVAVNNGPPRILGTWEQILVALDDQGVPAELFEPYRIEWERELVGTPDPWGIFRRLLARTIKVAGPITAPLHGEPKIVALIGPTGVGKTTTLAKLASKLGAAGERKRVGLLTADVYRLAAEDQLRKYADILQTPPLQVAHRPEDVPAALARLNTCEVVFVDTAGRSPHDEQHMDELLRYMEQIPQAEMHLVLSSTDRSEYLDVVIERFGRKRLTSLIFTKLDESCHYGALISAALRSQAPLSYYTTGQRVPQDIELVDPDKLVEVVVAPEVSQETG